MLAREGETKIGNAFQGTTIVKIFGVILIGIGILAMVIPSLTFPRREKIREIGPVKAEAEKKETVSLAPFLGMTAVAAGAAMVVAAVITKQR